ncbi:hypothetical protein [Runella sp. SP2]|uniref:hypothetical protein n=1 Tax=Runella sp. SP2 TaxID=2268026 RepID=UPI0013DE4803|nr:hypothetical protein [Runella sp. SP2]
MKKLPKRPKASASLQTWENYEKKVKDVQAENAKMAAAANKKKSIQAKTKGAKAVRGKK